MEDILQIYNCHITMENLLFEDTRHITGGAVNERLLFQREREKMKDNKSLNKQSNYVMGDTIFSR
jgi:hypothetical protein